MRRQACSQCWRSHGGDNRLGLLFLTLWSSTVHTVNFSLCAPACDWFSIEAYNAPKDGVVPAADYRLFLFGIGQTMHKLLFSLVAGIVPRTGCVFVNAEPRFPVSRERGGTGTNPHLPKVPRPRTGARFVPAKSSSSARSVLRTFAAALPRLPLSWGSALFGETVAAPYIGVALIPRRVIYSCGA
jgi:hypothetical protein